MKSTISDVQLRQEIRWSFGRRARLLKELAHIRQSARELQEKYDQERDRLDQDLIKHTNRFERVMALGRVLDEFLSVASARRVASNPEPPRPMKSEFRELSGFRIAFPQSESTGDSLAAELRHNDVFPAKHLQLLALGLTGRGGTMIDVGANIGLTTIPPLALGLVDKVIAVEPASVVLPFLQWNLVVNGLDEQVTIVPAVLGDVEGAIEFSLSRGIGLHRIKGDDASDVVATETVRELVLDQLVRAYGLTETAPRFVKIDTQGAEVRILRGARELLGRCESVFEVEFWPHGIESIGDDPREALDCMEVHFGRFLDEKSLPATLKPIGDLREAMNSLESGKHTDLLLLP